MLFTLVFHYADVTCITLSARIFMLVTLCNCVCVTISGHELFHANFLFNLNQCGRRLRKCKSCCEASSRSCRCSCTIKLNVDTSSSQSTSITTPNTRPSTNDHTSTSTASTSPHSPAASFSRSSGSSSSNFNNNRDL